MGLLSGGGAERSGRTRPVPEVPGVRVQLREPAVRQSGYNQYFYINNESHNYLHVKWIT